jgi:hypothetical protein
MVELIRTNDSVLIGFAEGLLQQAGFSVLVADRHTSIMEGSIGVIQRRILVPDDEARRARQFLRDAGLADELRDAE